MAKVVEFPMAAEAATEATVEASASCFMLMAAHAAPRDYVSRCMIKAHPLPPSTTGGFLRIGRWDSRDWVIKVIKMGSHTTI